MFKKPLENASPRTVRTIFTVAVLLILATMAVNFVDVMFTRATSNDQCAWEPRPDKKKSGLVIRDIVPGGVTDQAGIRDGDILLKINGKELRSGVEAMQIVNALRAGDEATYLIERDGMQFETEVVMLKVTNINFLALFLMGLGFLIVGYVVVMTKPEGEEQRRFARYGLLAALLFATYDIYLDAQHRMLWQVVLLGSGFVISRLFAVPMFVKYFLHFPVRRKIADRRWLNPVLYGVSAILLVYLMEGRRLPFADLGRRIVGGLIPLAFYIAGLIIFAHSYFAKVPVDRRHALRPIFFAVVIGIAAAIYMIVVSTAHPLAIFIQPSLLLPGLLIVSVPIAFGYSIFRYQLMDVGLLVKRSLTYGVVTAAMAAIYVLVVFGVGSVLSGMLGQADSAAMNVVALIIIAFALNPVKQRAQDAVDRLFYRERYNYQKALLEFSQELPQQLNLEQVLHSVVNRITGTMHIEKAAVVVCDATEGCSSVTKNISEELSAFEPNHDGFISFLRERKTPQSLALLAHQPQSFAFNDDDKRKLVRSGIVLAVPMFIQDRLIGTINVGPKLSGKVYSQEDVDLLSNVASQAAIAIENARLHRSEIEKQKIEEELDIARRIQEGLLPSKDPVVPGLELSGSSLPARMVGGDYYDYIRLDPNKLLVVIADVSGKGMSAALYMSKVQGMVQLASHLYSSPKEILSQVNRRLYEGIDRKSFVTIIVGLFDMERRELILCRAGHTKALIISKGKLQFLESSGIGAGLDKGPLFESKLEEVQYSLGSGDLFVFYTDGVTEAMNQRGEEFSEESLRELVNIHKHLSASELQQAISSAVNRFRDSTEQNDDETIVVVKVA